MTFFGCILLTGILASGWNDYDIALFEKYHLVRTNADTIMIYEEKGGFVVPPKIIGLGNKKNLIYGVCEKVKDSDIPCVPGYFLLDTHKSVVKIGLTKEDWLIELKKSGILKDPVLKKPSRFWNITNTFKEIFWLLPLGLISIIFWIIYVRKGNQSGSDTEIKKLKD